MSGGKNRGYRHKMCNILQIINSKYKITPTKTKNICNIKWKTYNLRCQRDETISVLIINIFRCITFGILVGKDIFLVRKLTKTACASWAYLSWVWWSAPDWKPKETFLVDFLKNIRVQRVHSKAE